MKTTRVSCQGCGASLEVQDLARYATCFYCSTKLEIHHEPAAIQAQALDILERHNRRLNAELIERRLRDELILIDTAWQRFRRGRMMEDGCGNLFDPSGAKAGGSAGLILLGVFMFGTMMNSGVPFASVGLLLILAGIVCLIACYGENRRFQCLEGRYQARRNALLARIEDAVLIRRENP